MGLFMGKDFRKTRKFGLEKHPITGAERNNLSSTYTAPIDAPILLHRDAVLDSIIVDEEGMRITFYFDDYELEYRHLAIHPALLNHIGKVIKKGALIGLMKQDIRCTGPCVVVSLYDHEELKHVEPEKVLEGYGYGQKPKTQESGE